MAGRTYATCTKCNRTFSKFTMIRVDKNNRGGNPAYICDDCNTEMHSYNTKNNKLRGADTVHPFTFGMENETTYSDAKARSELYEYDMLPTHDGTVDVEYKSCIEQSLKSFSHLWKVMDKLIAEGHMEIGDSAGSHFHVGHKNLNSETMDYIRRFYHSLFTGLSDEMKLHPEETKELFGREIDHYNESGRCWARSIDEYTDPENHTNFINVQHSKTLEFRMAKFRNSEQYTRMAKFATKVTDCVMTNFVEHFNDEVDINKLKRNWKLNFNEEIEISERNAQRMYRLFKAKMTSKKLVNLYIKAIER